MRLVVTEYVTLDGSFHNPGEWSFPFWSDEAAAFKFGELKATEAALYGRTTYEAFAAVWPSMTAEGEFADLMNGMPKHVVSTTIEKADWGPTTVIREDLTGAVTRLKQAPGGDLLVAGSGTLVRGLTEARLVDEYRFLLYPVILGRGPYLFPEGSGKTDLELVDRKEFPRGVMLLTYRAASTGD